MTKVSRICALTVGLFLNAPNVWALDDAQLQTALANLDKRAQKVIDEKQIVGMAIGVVHNDKLIWTKGYGPREIGKAEPIDADTVFQLASVSKPISATVVAGLVGKGKITWDSKISDLDPSFQMYDDYVTRELTIRDMYCHRSGLPEHAGDVVEDIGYDRAAVLHRLRYQRPFSSFRSHYAYTNFGMTEGAVAATKAYGTTWEQASEDELYKPLGMTSTSSRFSDYMARPNKSRSHVLVNGQWKHVEDRQPDAQSPAGGVSSSVNDMAKWMRLRLGKGKFEGKEIVASKPLEETEHPAMLTGFNPLTHLPGFYGLGINVSYDEQGRLHLGHSGAFALGNATCIGMIPSEQLGIIVLTNSYPVGVAEAMTDSFLDDALNGKQRADWLAIFRKIFADPATLGMDKNFDYSKAPAVVSPALALDSYVGTYSNDLYGDIVVENDGTSLVVMEGPQKRRFPMAHYTRDTFTYTPPGENAAGLAGLTFNIAPGGKADSVVVENLDEFHQGTFTRTGR